MSLDTHINFGFSKDGYAVIFIYDKLFDKLEPFFPEKLDEYIYKLNKPNIYTIRYPISKKTYNKIFKDDIDYENDKEYKKILKEIAEKINPITTVNIIPIKKKKW